MTHIRDREESFAVLVQPKARGRKAFNGMQHSPGKKASEAELRVAKKDL